MLENMFGMFKSFYTFPGLSIKWILLAIALALVFGAIWLVIYRPWHFNKAWLAIIFLVGAIVTWTAVAFIQVPLQIWTQDFLLNRLGMDGVIKWMLLAGVPLVLLSGLVQEGAKLVPVIAFWFKRKKQLDPLTGLYAGAISGAGFGIFEAIWVHNSIFASGWTWEIVSISGPTALLGFWERFFTIGFHIAVSALAGYGWAKGLRWQYYLIAAGLHTLANYSVILLNKGTLNINQLEIYIAGIAVVATVYAFLIMRGAAHPPATLVPIDTLETPETSIETEIAPLSIETEKSAVPEGTGNLENPNLPEKTENV